MTEIIVQIIRLDDRYYVRDDVGTGSKELSKKEVIAVLGLEDAYDEEEGGSTAQA